MTLMMLWMGRPGLWVGGDNRDREAADDLETNRHQSCTCIVVCMRVLTVNTNTAPDIKVRCNPNTLSLNSQQERRSHGNIRKALEISL